MHTNIYLAGSYKDTLIVFCGTVCLLLYMCVSRGKQAYREGSSEFGADRPQQTSSNHCDEGGCRQRGKVRVSSGRFEYTEPPRITVTKGETGLQGTLE